MPWAFLQNRPVDARHASVPRLVPRSLSEASIAPVMYVVQQKNKRSAWHMRECGVASCRTGFELSRGKNGLRNDRCSISLLGLWRQRHEEIGNFVGGKYVAVLKTAKQNVSSAGHHNTNVSLPMLKGVSSRLAQCSAEATGKPPLQPTFSHYVPHS